MYNVTTPDHGSRIAGNRVEMCFFGLLRLALDDSTDVSIPAGLTADEWQTVYEMATKQAVAGVIAIAINRLPDNRKPPKDMLMRWIGTYMAIRKNNALLYARSIELISRLAADGFRCCILKGQGNAAMYPDPYCRVPGDIDVWIDADRPSVVSYIRRSFPDVIVGYQHIDYPIFNDVLVEAHFLPSYMTDPITNHRMQRFFDIEKSVCCRNLVSLPDGMGRIPVPPHYFNAVYQLAHIFRHYMEQGIGLRQLIDYYYVLRNLEAERRPYVLTTLKALRLDKFSRAVMYIMHDVLGLDNSLLITDIDRWRGERLLHEIMSGGNFGKYNGKSWLYGKTMLSRQLLKFRRNCDMFMAYPSETVSEPFFRIYYYFWRKRHNRKR